MKAQDIPVRRYTQCGRRGKGKDGAVVVAAQAMGDLRVFGTMRRQDIRPPGQEVGEVGIDGTVL